MSRDPSSCRERRGLFGAGVAGLVVAVLATLAAVVPVVAAPRYPGKPPASIAGLDYIGITDFEREHPGLGRVYQYGVPVADLDVFLYALGLRSTPTAADVDAAFRQSAEEITRTAREGYYRDLRPRARFELKVDGRSFQCQHFTFDRKDIGATSSYLCVGVGYGQFLKVRLSLEAPVEKELPGKTVLKAALAAFSD